MYVASREGGARGEGQRGCGLLLTMYVRKQYFNLGDFLIGRSRCHPEI